MEPQPSVDASRTHTVITWPDRRIRGIPHSVRDHPRPHLAKLPSTVHLSPMTEIIARLSTALADRYKIKRHLGEAGMANVPR